jgi:ATP-dependent exoDNAse (exonuclease V) alpha subunit
MDLAGSRIPKKLGCDPVHDIQVLCPMNRGALGTRQMNAALQERLKKALATAIRNGRAAERFSALYERLSQKGTATAQPIP